MRRKNINYTHTLYNTETGFNRGVFKAIRTYRCLGILLKKVLILPILKHHRRKAHTEIVGFSIVAVCQMRDEAIHPASLWELEHLAFFNSKKHRRYT